MRQRRKRRRVKEECEQIVIGIHSRIGKRSSTANLSSLLKAPLNSGKTFHVAFDCLSSPVYS